MLVNVDLLKAAIYCAPVKANIRNYLNSVLVECLGDSYKVVATDGHILGCFTGKNESELVVAKLRGKICRI